jgi:hypothetical protein
MIAVYVIALFYIGVGVAAADAGVKKEKALLLTASCSPAV